MVYEEENKKRENPPMIPRIVRMASAETIVKQRKKRIWIMF